MSDNPVENPKLPEPNQTNKVQQPAAEAIAKARQEMEARIAADQVLAKEQREKTEQERLAKEQEKKEQESRAKEEIVIGERVTDQMRKLTMIQQVLKDSGVDSMSTIKAMARITDILGW